MLRSVIIRIVDGSARHPGWVIALALVLSALSAVYAGRNFAIKTDINELISPDLPWARRVQRFLGAFPQREILVVVDAPTPELVERAADRLQHALEANPELFPAVRQPQGGSFFARNGLLYLPTDEVRRAAGWLTRADDLIGTLAADPSLRGALDALSLGIIGVQRKEIALDDMAQTLTMAAGTLEAVLAGQPATFSWRVLASNRPAEPGDLRRLIEVQPKLDYGALEPGRAATEAIRQAADRLTLATDDLARVRVTGLIPMDDDEFASVKQNAGLNATGTLLALLAILWLALRSARIIVAVGVSIAIGLAISVAWGLILVGALNLI